MRTPAVLIAGVWISLLLPAAWAEDGIDQSNVYQRIKDADDNGLSVGRFQEGHAVPNTDIVLDEQGQASGGRSNDAAGRPLFRHVNEAKLTGGTYAEFFELIDNYVVQSGKAESVDANEEEEIDAFVDKAMLSHPMQVAFAYVTEDLGVGMTKPQFREAVEKIWFETFINYFGGNETPHCSGFEHVFVGEGKFPASGAGQRRGEISGYHGWLRFYRDEKAGIANYLGHKYDLPPARKPANPGAITLRMIWNLDDDDNPSTPPVELYKPKGGFFVGMSPECELAIGTVAFFELQEGLLNGDKRRTVIDGVTYDLVLYASVKENGQRGDHIRSFFPAVVGLAQPQSGGDGEPTASSGPISITRALPNPAGTDETGEWVEIKNESDGEIDLTNWELRDRQGGTRKLEGTIAAGATKRFEIPRDQFSLRLGNASGEIKLFADNALVHEVSYGRAETDEVITFP